MNPHIKSLILFGFFIVLSHFVKGQDHNLHQYNNTSYSLVGDTLFSNKDFKIFKGQKLVCGNAIGENERYNSIMFISPTSLPLLLWRNMEINNNLDYHHDEDLADEVNVKEFLSPGDTLIVTNIIKRGNNRYGYSYILNLKQVQGMLSLNYSCYIVDAIKSGELLVINE